MPRGGKGYSELADAGPSTRPPPTMNRPGLAHLHTATPPPTPESLMRDKDIDPERTASTPATRTASESPPPPASPPPGHTDGHSPTNEGNASRSKNRSRMKKWLKRGGGGGGESRLGKWNPALTLENSGSVARDHLASERTFLAYVRTSLAIASTGVALVQLFTISAAATTDKAIQAYARPLGAVVIAIGLGTLILGTTRYFAIQNALIGGNYPVARVSTILLALVLCAIVIVVFGIIVGVRSKS